MKCTCCKSGTLKPMRLDDLFPAHQCDHCQGHWILIEDFVYWQASHVDFHFEPSDEAIEVDSQSVLLCPITGSLMQKYKFTADGQHKLDYSPMVGGVWLDKGEWSLLKREGLAGLLNKIVTPSWQKKLREGHAETVFAQLYEAKFGFEAYKKIKDFREWMLQQPAAVEIQAYLMAKDPYSAER